MMNSHPNPQAVRWALLRLALASLLVSALAWGFSASLARAYLPILGWAYAQLDSDHDVVSLTLSSRHVTGGYDSVYTLVVAPHSYIVVGNAVVATKQTGRGRVSVVTAYAWQPLVIALPLLLAWPVRRWTDWPIRLTAFACCAVPIALFNMPTLMWSEVWAYYVSAVPGSTSWLVRWGHFLTNGGQLLLGILVVWLCICAGLWRPTQAIKAGCETRMPDTNTHPYGA